MMVNSYNTFDQPFPRLSSVIDCSISIVNYNTGELLVKCIDSIQKFTRGISYEVIVVDNASTDESAQKIQIRFPSVKIIQNKENLFFTKASNQGLKESRGRTAITLNPDCYLEEDALSAMVRYLDENPDVGACGPTFLNPDGSQQSLGHSFPGILYPFFELLFINALFPGNPIRTARDYKENILQEIDAMGGGGIMVKREVLGSVGYLDEGFLMYFEDTDWCKRIRSQGWRIMHLPHAKVFHFGGAATIKVNRSKFEKIQQESMLYYYRKYYGAFIFQLIRVILFCFHNPLLSTVRFFKRKFQYSV